MPKCSLPVSVLRVQVEGNVCATSDVPGCEET